MAPPGTDPGFAALAAGTILAALFLKKNNKITNTKLGTKVNIYFWFLLRPWKRPM
jgi:hypothetical protein